MFNVTVAPEPDGDVRRRLPKSERRKRILAEARAAFLEAGGTLNGATVRSIADRCGVDQALIFRHFDTKEDLYREAVLAPIELVVCSLADNAAQMALAESASERVTRIWDLTYNVVVQLLALPPDVIRTVAMLLFSKVSEAPAFYHRTLKPALSSFEAIVESARIGSIVRSRNRSACECSSQPASGCRSRPRLRENRCTLRKLRAT